MKSARTSRLPSRSRALRPAYSALTTEPIHMTTWISSALFLRCSTPLFDCCPMSWRISAIPKSLSVPVSAMDQSSRVRRKASRTANA